MVVAQQAVPLCAISRVLRLSMADYPAVAIVRPLQRALRSVAPGIDIVVQPWHGAPTAVAALRNGDTDIAVSVFDSEVDDLVRTELLQESYVVALRKGHPATHVFDLDRWLDWPHIVVSGNGVRRGNVDAILEAAGRQRRIGLVVPSFQMVPALLFDSDMIALMPSHSLLPTALPGLCILRPPVPVPGFTLHSASHRRNDGDPVIDLVTDLLANAVEEIPAAAP